MKLWTYLDRGVPRLREEHRGKGCGRHSDARRFTPGARAVTTLLTREEAADPSLDASKVSA